MTSFIMENLHYIPLEDWETASHVAVCGYEEGILDVIVPNQVEHEGISYQVTRVKSGSFQNCSTLKSITFPDSFVKVEEESFLKCKNLEKVSYAGKMKIYMKNTFKECPKLQEEQGLVILDDIVVDYFGKSDHLSIPEGVTEINFEVFQKNKKLVSVTFPTTLKKIGWSAFESCANLREITLPKDLEVLQARAFALCKGLGKVTIPEKLTNIHEETFIRCENLKEITFPAHLESIQSKAFYNCKQLKEVRFHESLKKLDKLAFRGCESLETIFFSENSNIKIIKKTFLYTDNLLHVSDVVLKTWSESERMNFRFHQICQWELLLEEEKSFFLEKWAGIQLTKKEKSITDLVKNGTVTVSFTQMFSHSFGNISSDAIEIKNPIRDMVFERGSGKEVALYFDLGFHLDLEDLNDALALSIEKGDTSKTAELLNYKNLNFTKEEIEQLDNDLNLVEMGMKSPTRKQLKKKWVIQEYEDYITLVGYEGTKREEVIPESIDTGKPIKYVDSEVFHAFYSENLGYNLSHSPVYNGYVPKPPQCYAPLERMIFANGDEILMTEQYKNSTIKELNFPPNTEIIENELFFHCVNIKKVVIPDSVVEISHDAFSHCTALEEVVLSENLISLKEACFYRCYSLKHINFPPKLDHISGCAFADCHSLVEIKLPDSLLELEDNVFLNCKNLRKVIISRNTRKIHPDAFSECPNLEFVGYEDGENVLKAVRSGKMKTGWEKII